VIWESRACEKSAKVVLVALILSPDLFICAKYLFVEAKEGQLAPLHF